MNAPVASKSITINAPTTVVWDIISDIRNRTAWDVTIQSIELFDEVQVGAKGKIFPARGPANAFTVTLIEPLKCLKMSSPLMWSTMEFSHILTPKNDVTEVTFDIQCVGTQAGVIAGMFRSIFSNNLEKALPSLKELAEKKVTVS